MRTLFLIAPVVALTLAACGSSSDTAPEQKAESVDTLYTEAQTKLENKEYRTAVKAFEEVERQHPYSDWANRAQVMGAYAAYRGGDYDQAVSMLNRFVKMHPSSESTPYAYYLISLCYYEQISDVGRDQKMTEEALQALTEVVKRFPETEYARDAKLKLDLTYDHLAGKEMQVGRYYLVRNDYLAAINRFRFVVENYQTTSHVPEALHRLVEAYLLLGVPEEAKRYGAVLGHNYPGSVWYKDSFALLTGEKAAASKDEGWLSKMVP